MTELVRTSTFKTDRSESIVRVRKALRVLQEEVNGPSGSISERVLRAMHNVGMSSYKDFENSPLEEAINELTGELYSTIPIYQYLTPLGEDFGKRDPI